MYRTTLSVAAVDCGTTKIFCQHTQIKTLPQIVLHQGDPSIENLSIGVPMLFPRIRDKINQYMVKFFKWMSDSTSLDNLREQAARADKLLAVYVTDTTKFISEGIQKIVLSVVSFHLGSLQKTDVSVHKFQFSEVTAGMESLQVPLTADLHTIRSLERNTCGWCLEMPT